MDYLYSLLLAVVQALTEFLPISSSGHLVVLHQIIPAEMINNLTFDVFLHAGTLFSLIIFFWKEIVGLFKSFFSSLVNWNLKNDFNQRLAWLIILGNIPAAVVGYWFGDQIENFFRSVGWVIVMLVLGGLLFLLAEKISQKNRPYDQLTFKDALLIGLAQVLAFIPGVSRSGITIVTGLANNLERSAAARFSFLLSVPVIFGATLKQALTLSASQLSSEIIIVYLIGIVFSALAGYLVIKFLLKFLTSHSLRVFAYYRLVLAALLVIIFVL